MTGENKFLLQLAGLRWSMETVSVGMGMTDRECVAIVPPPTVVRALPPFELDGSL